MPQYPKFDSKVKQNLIRSGVKQTPTSGYGIIAGYDPASNTATVLMAARGSDSFGQAFKDVPCPVIMGANFTAPEPGRPCWVDYKDDNEGYPVVISYFNPLYDTFDYSRQTAASSNIPRYLYAM